MRADEGGLTGEWTIDPAHTRIGFSARHAMVTKVRGVFNDLDGTVHVAHPLTASTAAVRLRAASVDTRDAARDTHLRSPDFFDAERYPELVFTSSAVDQVGERSFVVVGDLAIRDITRQVLVPLELTGVSRDHLGALRAGFEGSRRVDRRDWGLRWQRALDAGGVLVSERITLEFDVSLVKVEDAEEPGRPAAAEVRPDDAEPSVDPSAPPVDPSEPVRTRRGGRHRAPSAGWLGRWRASAGRG